MAWALVFVLAVFGGWLLARALTRNAWCGPRWASELGLAALAVLFGVGLASIGGFALTAAHLARPVPIFAMLAAAALLWLWLGRGRSSPVTNDETAAHETPARQSRRFPWTWALAAAVIAGCALLTADFLAATRANPDGEWDATAIWNLRARFLAAGPEMWRRAISAETGAFMIGSSHPGYPLFVSSFLAMQWTAAGSYVDAAPATLSLLIALSLVALLIAAVAARRSTALGLLAGLVLIGSEVVASQVSAQYADLPLALAFLAAIVLLDAVSQEDDEGHFSLIAAGLAIGFAPWIKNEGLPFAIAALAVAAWRFRGRVAWVIAGSAPGLLAVAALKLMAEGRESMFPTTTAELLGKLATPSRWIQSLAGFGKGIYDAGPLWAHPVILVAALALVLRFVPATERRARIWLAVPIAATLAAEYGLYLITAADLTWHISTSVSRLIAQVWPSLLYLAFSILRTPEEYFDAPPLEPAAVVAPKGSSLPKKRKRAGA